MQIQVNQPSLSSALMALNFTAGSQDSWLKLASACLCCTSDWLSA